MTEPSTSILGAPSMYVSVGSTINITCIIRNAAEFPATVRELLSVTQCHAPTSRVTCQYPSSQPDNENNRQRPTAIVWMSDVFAVIVSKMCTFINGWWSAQGGILSTSGSDL